ncbi:MAG: S9 family peptidase [Pseudomonadota bacterium]
MYRLLTIIALTTALAVTAFADVRVPTREFFEHSLVNSVRISPDGKHMGVTYEEGTQVKVAIMEVDSLKVIQAFEFGEYQQVLRLWWGSDERVVMSVGKVTGNLDNLGRPSFWYAANINGKKRQQIYDAQTSFYQMLNPLPDDDRHVLIARYAGGDVPKAHLLDIYDGDVDFIGGVAEDPDLRQIAADNEGVVRIAAAIKMGETMDDRDLRLYIRDTGASEWESLDMPLMRNAPEINFMAFSSDDRSVFFSSDHDMADDGRLGVFEYNFDTKAIDLRYRDATVDVAGLLRAPGGEVVGAFSRQGPAEYSIFDNVADDKPDVLKLMQGILSAFPGEDVSIISASEDGTRNIIFARGDRNPGAFYLLDTNEMKLRFLVERMPDLPKEALVKMEPVMFEARDGLEIHGFLTRPAGWEGEKVPLILNIHGGPFGITDFWGYNSEAQFFAHNGYATLSVNYRGSGNRGQDFQRKGYREWGGKMQDDVTDATLWAIEQGIADPDRICIYGGSYGGYATLSGVVKEPDLYKCGVGYVGVYDLTWFRKGDGSDFSRNRGRSSRENFERFMSSAVGESPESVKPNSPVHHVDRIKAELFIVHGAADVRVPVGHAYRLRDALDEIGKDYEWMIKEKEGHGFMNVDNRVDLYTAMLAFFDKHIGRGTDVVDTLEAASQGQ